MVILSSVAGAGVGPPHSPCLLILIHKVVSCVFIVRIRKRQWTIETVLHLQIEYYEMKNNEYYEGIAH